MSTAALAQSMRDTFHSVAVSVADERIAYANCFAVDLAILRGEYSLAKRLVDQLTKYMATDYEIEIMLNTRKAMLAAGKLVGGGEQS